MNRLPGEVHSLIEALKAVDGIQTIVLGGSRARGTHTPASDVDLGIYYCHDRPLDVQKLDEIASDLDDRHATGLVTPIGGWGPWINGGGWLKISGIPVDLIYRDLEKVQLTINNCILGKVDIAYQPGHPFGFLSSIYAAETALCLPLWDPTNQLGEVKGQLAVYPPLLKRELVQKFAWEIQFSIEIAEKAVPRRDVLYAAGCLFRCVECVLVVLFALNEQHWMNEKGALSIAEGFALQPDRLSERVETLFALLAADETRLREAISMAMQLGAEVNALVSEVIPPV